MRISTVDDLLELLDRVVAESDRGDASSRQRGAARGARRTTPGCG